MQYAALNGDINILRFLATLMQNPNSHDNEYENFGRTPIDIENFVVMMNLQSYI